MNVPALSSQPAVQSALLGLQGSATPTAAQLEADRKALGQSTNSKSAAGTSPADIKKAASQFEAIILRQLLAPSIEPVMSGGLGGTQSAGGGIYGYMLTDVLSNNLAQGGGLGLARMLEKQLSPAPLGADINPDSVSKPSNAHPPL